MLALVTVIYILNIKAVLASRRVHGSVFRPDGAFKPHPAGSGGAYKFAYTLVHANPVTINPSPIQPETVL